MRLRADHVHALTEMHRIGGGSLSFEEFVQQVLEAAIADFRLIKIIDDSGKLPPPGPLITTPKKSRKKLDQEAVEMILSMRDAGEKTGTIAARFQCSPMTVQRIYREHY
jgi:hypothetical protein